MIESGLDVRRPAEPIPYRQPSIRDSLCSKRASLEAQLEDVNKAIAALDANPGVEQVLDLVSKTIRF